MKKLIVEVVKAAGTAALVKIAKMIVESKKGTGQS